MELISKKEVMNILDYNRTHSIRIYEDTYRLPIETISSTAIKQIDRLPIIDSNKVIYPCKAKGKWEKHKTKSGKNWWKCSQCGHVEMKRYPYCAICGSGMRGE